MCLLSYSWKHVWKKKTMGLVCLLFGRIFQCFVSFPQAAVHGAPWEDHQKALRKPSEMMDQTWRRNLLQTFPPQRHHFRVMCMEGKNYRDPCSYLHTVLDTSKAAVKSRSQISSAFTAGGINLCHLD